MITRLRDTPFGHLVRISSRYKLLQYPDEVDASLWKECLREKPSVANDSGSGAFVDSGVEDPNANDDEEYVRGSIRVVKWYGTDDPEVGPPLSIAVDRT